MYIIGNTIKSASEFEVYFLTKAQTKFSLSEKCSLVSSFECTSLQFLIVVIEYAYARVAQLVEYDLAKVGVAGSSPVSRSFYFKPCFQGFFFYIEIYLRS